MEAFDYCQHYANLLFFKPGPNWLWTTFTDAGRRFRRYVRVLDEYGTALVRDMVRERRAEEAAAGVHRPLDDAVRFFCMYVTTTTTLIPCCYSSSTLHPPSRTNLPGPHAGEEEEARDDPVLLPGRRVARGAGGPPDGRAPSARGHELSDRGPGRRGAGGLGVLDVRVGGWVGGLTFPRLPLLI